MFDNRMKRIAIGLGLVTAALAAAGAAEAGTLENLERERALLVELILDPELDAEQRAGRLDKAQHRLVDLERMTLRDRSLRGKNSPVVRKAFERYDLTFLVHASVENERSVTDQWLDEVGISTDSLMAARKGKR
ncbi:MAG: hypothetical protein JRG96_20310 [Deltaproteobacteria bacterium]|nr:hypothetical protein [Deltaproteobacteria bacterium]